MIEIDSKLLALDNLSLFKIFRFEEDKFHTEFDSILNSVDIKIKSRIRLKNKKSPDTFPNMKTFNVCENIEIYSNIENKSAKNLFCPICLDLMIFPVLINCGHSYCRVCIYEFSNIYDNCLLCPGLINQSKYLQNKILSTAILKYVKRNLPNRLQVLYARRLKKHKYYLLKRKYRVDDSKLGEIVNIRQIDFQWEKGVINRIEKFKNVTVGRVLLVKDYEKQVHSNSLERYVNLESDDVISV